MSAQQNPKSEYRNPKQTKPVKSKKTEIQTSWLGIVRLFDHWICFQSRVLNWDSSGFVMRIIHHGGTEFAELGVFFNQPILILPAPSAVQSSSPYFEMALPGLTLQKDPDL
jgi:hypothetical protein